MKQKKNQILSPLKLINKNVVIVNGIIYIYT